MSSQPSQPHKRSARARLLVVGSSAAVREFIDHTRRQIGAVSEVSSLCDAIAEVRAATAREPINAIAISSDCEGFDAAQVKRAFDRVDGIASLILLYREGQEELSEAAIGLGFDDTIPLPCSHGELIELLTEHQFLGHTEQKKSHDEAGDPAPPSNTIPPPRKVVDIQIAKAMAHVHPETPPISPRADIAAEPSAATSTPVPTAAMPSSQRLRKPAFSMPPISRPATKGTSEGPPNDLTLVRAVIDGDNLRAVALHALQHQLGTIDVRLVPEARPGEEEAIARERIGLRQVHVIGRHGSFGVLLSKTIEQATLEAWALWLAEWIDLDESHRNLRRLAWSDELTGAGNRRALLELLPSTLAKALQDRRSVSLMYLDIDNFKQYNERFGHALGDEVLRESVEVLRSCIRAGDHVFRMGGDEFVILFCDPNPPRNGGGGVPEDVEVIAERCRKAVRELQLPLLASSGSSAITMSAGFALYPWEASDGKDLLSLADQRALRAKLDGKDTIVFGSPPSLNGGAHGAPRRDSD